MITDWAVVAEPAIAPTFTDPFARQYFFPTDIQILNSGKGVIMLAPNQSFLYRMFVDYDGAVATEFVGNFMSLPATTPPPGNSFPVFGQVEGDLLIYAASAGIIFPMGSVSQGKSLNRVRLRVDNDGALVTEPVTLGYWILIPENNIPIAIDVNSNWMYIQDLVASVPGIGIVMPMRGSTQTRRVRVDFDGAILSETV